jgi:golgi-specific brefeldin A-resistance guanine nucleotide exchange factor 1
LLICSLKDGLASIIELLRVLVNVLDPNDQSHTDSTRLVSLGTLNVAFEEAGPRIAQFSSLESIILDPGCKFLFQLARSENPWVLQSALRTITTLFDTMREHLKLQQELFLAFTMDRLAPPLPPGGARTQQQLAGRKGLNDSPRPGTPATPVLGPSEPDAGEEKGTATPPRVLVAPARGDTRDLILETLSQIARHPSFMVDLYTSYDCDVNSENMFERLIDFLTKVSFSHRHQIGISLWDYRLCILQILVAHLMYASVMLSIYVLIYSSHLSTI